MTSDFDYDMKSAITAAEAAAKQAMVTECEASLIQLLKKEKPAGQQQHFRIRAVRDGVIGG